jgi:hypothetical protein
MDNQLPAEWQQRLTGEALRLFPEQWHHVQSDLSTDLNAYPRHLWVEGATEYANKLLQSDEAVKMLQKTCEKYYAEIIELKAKCDKYEAALKDILKQRDYYSVIELADKALSAGEGEKVPQKQDQPDLGNCQRCGITKASTKYSDLCVCDHCDKMLNNEFDEKYK